MFKTLVLLLLTSWAQIPAPTPAKEDLKPERSFDGHALVSPRDPALRLSLGKDYKYAGAQRFTLYDVANAEQHFFVKTAPDNSIQSLYWIQFEEYLPTNQSTYGYKFEKVTTISGRSFDTVSGASNTSQRRGRPDSDGNRAVDFLTQKGYKLPSEVMRVRFVHLPDAGRRKELMIIYAEDMASLGKTSADLSPGGSAAAEWSKISDDLVKRGAAGITITPAKTSE
jgi:hypothetical protein